VGEPIPIQTATPTLSSSPVLQDAITRETGLSTVGLRGDFYNALTTHKEAEPRVGIAYNIKKTNTVLRASYARILETPFNENLVLSSTGCATRC